MVVWLSSVALGQFGVVVEHKPAMKASQERTVPRSPRASINTPVVVVPRDEPAAVA